MREDYFEWDRVKAAANLRKHGISFEEAASVFKDPQLRIQFDNEHSDTEDRYLAIGRSRTMNVLLVVHTERRSATRIISARLATTTERQIYESEN